MPETPSTRKPTLRQRRFIKEYLKDGDGARAVREAGYSHKNVKRTAVRLLEAPHVLKEIEAVRQTLRKDAEYNLETAMAEAEKGMELAEKRGQISAYVKAAELRAKLQGFLVDRHHVEFDMPDINAALQTARGRVSYPLKPDEIEDAEFSEVGNDIFK